MKVYVFVFDILAGIWVSVTRLLQPATEYIRNCRFIGPFTELIIRLLFWYGFISSLLFDWFIRSMLKPFIGYHIPTGCAYSMVNACDPLFQPNGMFTNNNQFSLTDCYSLATCCKLVYEDMAVIRSELLESGFDMETFQPIHFKNTIGFCVAKDNNVVLVFRGSEPFNMQNIKTDMQHRLVEIAGENGYDNCGRVHIGFLRSLGIEGIYRSKSLFHSQSASSINISVTSGTPWLTAYSTMNALRTLVSFAVSSIAYHFIEPVDDRFTGLQERFISAYDQADQHLQQILKPGMKLYLGGHSSGGAIATLYLSKLIQTSSPHLNNFHALYTCKYRFNVDGCPRMGDTAFTNSFPPSAAHNIYRVVHNNDMTARMPPELPYSDGPGNLIFITSSSQIIQYPCRFLENSKNVDFLNHPNVREISFIHLSGLLNERIIKRLREESWLRIAYRIFFPFFVNDHFMCDYVRRLKEHVVVKD